jgi:hypothetical protein
VYKCEAADGSISYQAKFCSNPSDIQTELSCYNAPLSAKAYEQLQSKLAQQRKYLIKKQKLEKEQSIKLAKKQRVEAKMRQRYTVKCEKVKQQIDEIMQHYRTGYTIKQGITLDRKLSDYQKQRQKYCNYE